MLATSPDGHWAIVRRGRVVMLLADAAAPAVGRIELANEDVELAFVGSPTVVVEVSRGGGGTNVVLHQLPSLEAVARLELEQPMKLAAITGPRVVLVSPDGKTVQIVRVAVRALAATRIDVGSPLEFTVGLERNQVLFGLLRKLEVWDAVSARPLLRLQLQLPPPPRKVGAALGHVWVTRPGSDEVFIYRLSDGRPFRHYVGAPVDDVVSHPASPLIVLTTSRGLIRLHCLAHSLTVVDAPWTPGMPLAQLVAGDEVSLLGITAGSDEPWRVPLGVSGAPSVAAEPAEVAEPAETVAHKLRALRERAQETPRASAAPTATAAEVPSPAPPTANPVPVPPTVTAAEVPSPAPPTAGPVPALPPPSPAVHARPPAWREPLAAFGHELVRGGGGELPVVAVESELSGLAHRLALPATARRALIVLYSSYLVGEPALSISRLSRALADWTEALGQGELHALAMLRRQDGKVSLRATVTDLLDGLSPRAIRFVGDAPATQRPGITRLARSGRTDAAIEASLAIQLGRIAVIEGGAARGVLEARLQGATALALVAPRDRPQPWPREAGLIVVADADAPPWVAALAATAS